MSNYKKVDIDTIKAKLQAGEYAGSTGAMRAIGKTQGLSDKDKDKLRDLVRKHFGESAPAPKAGRAKKATKKTAKKTAKKVSKKASASVAPPAAKPAKAGRKKVAKKVAKRGGRGGRAKAPTEVDTGAGEVEKPVSLQHTLRNSSTGVVPVAHSSGKDSVVPLMGQIIGTISQSLTAMELAKKLFPKGEFDRDVEMMGGAMARAVRVIDQEVTAPHLGEKAPEGTAATGRKKAAKKGTRAKVESVTAPEAESEGDESPEVEADDTDTDGNTPELTEEEQALVEAGRQTQQQAVGDD